MLSRKVLIATLKSIAVATCEATMSVMKAEATIVHIRRDRSEAHMK